jgi:hypothetical protein
MSLPHWRHDPKPFAVLALFATQHPAMHRYEAPQRSLPLRFFFAALPLVVVLTACGGGNVPQAPAGNQQAATEPVASQAPTAPAAQPAATAASPDLSPLFGTWGFDAPACSSPIKIAETSFEGAENSCEISGFVDNGDGSFTATLACSSQGQTADERIAMTPLFGPQGEGVRLDYLDRQGEPVTVFRCKTNGGD